MTVVIRSAALAAGLGVLTFLAGCSLDWDGAGAGRAAARNKGAKAAAAAIAAGSITLRDYPPPPASAEHGEYIKLLRDRCGVGYEASDLPPGVAREDFVQEVQGWNAVMQAEIQRRFGPRILAELREEAHKRWQERAAGRQG